jgi:Zn-dependent protease
MLLRLFNQFPDNPPALLVFFAAFMVALVTGIGFHEFSHAWAANELGDDTAAKRGRLTLNPLAHIDPMGMLAMLLIGFGWGKPTPVNPYRLRNGVKRGNMLVALAGPASNFVFAIIAAIPLRLGLIHTTFDPNNIRDASGQDFIGLFLFYIVSFNVLLGIFNLIPIPPLDGFKVAVGILPGEASRKLASLERYGMGVLFTLFALSWFTPFNPLGWLIGGVWDEIFRLII